MAGRGFASVGTKALGRFRKLGVDKLFRRAGRQRPAHVQRAIDDPMQVGTGQEKILARNARLKDIASAGKRGENPLDLVPTHATKKVLHPIQGKATVRCPVHVG